MLDGEAHRRGRGMMLPAFHGDSVRGQVSEMVAITAEEVAGWPVGDQFPVLPRTQAITLEVILRTVIGVQEKDRLARVAHRAAADGESGSPLELLPPPRVLRNVGLWRRREQRKARARALLREEITRCATARPVPPITGDVIGFTLRWDDQARGALGISSDTVLYDGIRPNRRARRGQPRPAAPRRRPLPITGPLRYTMTVADAVELCRLIRSHTVIPVHYEGWQHPRQGHVAIETPSPPPHPASVGSSTGSPSASESTAQPVVNDN